MFYFLALYLLCILWPCFTFFSRAICLNIFMFNSRFREKLGLKVVKALKRGDSGVAHASIDMLCALMQVSSCNNLFKHFIFV